MINKYHLKGKIVLQIQDYYFIFSTCISFYDAFPFSVLANVTVDIKVQIYIFGIY